MKIYVDTKIYGIIYKITNLVNSKCYIGQTTQTIKVRFREHCSDSKRKTIKMAISHAIKKYGKENFTIELIDTAYNQQQLNLLEGVYISWFKSLIIENGYNITKIINGKGKMSNDTKEKIRKKCTEPERLKQAYERGKKRRGISYENSSSKYCGVYFAHKKWKAVFNLNNKIIYLGTFLTEEDAAKAHDIAEIKYFGNEAILNFPKLREKYLKNEIIVNKCKKRSDSNITGVSFDYTGNRWAYNSKGIRKSFKTKEEVENFALECLKIRLEKSNFNIH